MHQGIILLKFVVSELFKSKLNNELVIIQHIKIKYWYSLEPNIEEVSFDIFLLQSIGYPIRSSVTKCPILEVYCVIIVHSSKYIHHQIFVTHADK